ncbi:MAG: hypothetical protein ABIQ40_06945 [Bacteroidia bacterium]
MHKIVRISTSLFLSLFILVSGSGLIIGKMVCLKSGYVQIAANEVKDCCNDQAKAVQFKDQCCDINNVAFQQQQFVGQNQLVVKASDVSSIIVLPDFLIFSTANFVSTGTHFSPSDPPDLISGSSALPLLCVFRV